MEGHSTKELKRQVKMLQQNLNVERKSVKNYLEYQKKQIQSSIILKNKCCSSGIKVEKSFHQNFKKLSQNQKLSFYAMNLANTRKIIEGKKEVQKFRECLDQEYYLMMKIHGEDEWFPCKVRLIGDLYGLELQRNINVDLRNCLLRNSRNSNNQIILLLTNPRYKQIRFKYQNEQKNFPSSLIKLWQQSQFIKILQMFQLSTKSTESSPLKTWNQSLSQMNEGAENKLVWMFEEFKGNKFLKTLEQFESFVEEEDGFFVDSQRNRIRRIFKLSNLCTENLLLEIIGKIKHNKMRKQCVKQIKIIQNFPNQSINIYYQIDEINQKRFKYTYARHFFTNNKEYYIIDKSIKRQDLLKDKNVFEGIIQYCIWRIVKRQGFMELIVQANMRYENKVTHQEINFKEVVKQFIGEFDGYLQSECLSKEILYTEDFQDEYLSSFSDDNNLFFTVQGSLQDSQISLKTHHHHPHSTNTYPSSNSVINSRHAIEPVPDLNPQYFHLQKGHIYLGEDWRIDDEGYLRFLNEEKVKIQRGAIRILMQKLGRNIFSGKGIMNISLPVQLFSDKSYVEFIATGYLFAPRFLEKAAVDDSAIQRIKAVFCTKIGGKYILKMQKPFNPILGETYQGTIHGCPIYGEQISHHPPITSIYMVGRGYKMHSTVEPTVHLGLNKVHQINQGTYYIHFDKYNQIVKFCHSPLQMQGVITGDRKGASIDSSYIINEKERLFVQVQWGKNKSIKRNQAKYVDFVYGKLVKLKSNVDLTKWNKIKPSHYETVYGEFHGRLTESIYFNEEKILNLHEDHPHKLINCKYSLQSDSHKRKDILFRCQNNLQQAQIQKQLLQQQQRQDRKLRANFQK